MSSWFELSVGCLNTTGALDIVPGAEALAEGSMRLAYNERPARGSFDVLSGPTIFQIDSVVLYGANLIRTRALK